MIRPVQIHGHRGARGLFPENTLEGFARALAIGVDALELDVGMTADNVPVVTHDPRLRPDITRGPDGRWLAAPGPLIRHLRAAELAAYDVGRIDPASSYSGLFPEQYPCDGATIPTLLHVLQTFPDVRFSIELKTFPGRPEWTAPPDSMARAVLDAVDRAGAANRVLIESFDWRGPRYVRAVRPEIRAGWLTGGAQTDLGLWHGPSGRSAQSVPETVAAEGGPVWGPNNRELTAALVEEAHRLGLQVVPWTVNAPADMGRLVSWGVDALVTDRPDLARTVLTALGLPLAAAAKKPTRC